MFEVERPTFSHRINRSVPLMKAVAVRLLAITLIPFLSYVSVRIPNVLEPVILCLVSKGSLDAKTSLPSSVTHISVFELPVAHSQVTVSPGHTDRLSQVIEISLSVKSRCNDHNTLC